MLRVAFVLLWFVSPAALAWQLAEPAPPPRTRAPKDADQAREFYLRRRAGEAKEIPEDKVEAAMARAARMRPYSIAGPRSSGKTRAAGQIDLGGWRQLGPANVGGRTKALLIHPTQPDILYAGAVTGGVWKSEDRGRTWRPIGDRLPSIGIGALAFDPSNPDTLYAGTGFWFNALSASNVWGSAPRGTGIFRSTDAGATWQPLATPPNNVFRYVNQIIVSRHDPKRIYAATWTGIYRSTDGGQSWTVSLDRGTANGCQSMVARSDKDTDYLFAACGTTVANEPAIFRNPDAGASANWERVHQPTGMANTTLALAPSNQDIVYALSASNDPRKPEFANGLLAVFRSTASGDAGTWEARVTNENPEPLNTALLSNNQSYFSDVCAGGTRSIASQGWIHNAIAVDPVNPEVVWVGGIDLYRSDDGGANWGLASFWQLDRTPAGAHADVLGFAFPPGYDGDGNQAMYVTTDGGVYRTLNARAATATGPRGGCLPARHEITWTGLHGGFTTTQFYHGSAYPGSGAYFGGMQDNGTWRGTDGGEQDWDNVFGGDGGVSLVDPGDANVVYFSTQNFGFRRSENGGLTSAAAVRGFNEGSAAVLFITPVILDPHEPGRLYMGGRRVWRTDNRGTQWNPVSTALPTASGRISALAVSPSDPNRMVVATEAGFVYRTSSALGLTPETEWQSARPRSGFAASVAFHPTNPDVVYVAYSQYKTASGQSMIYRSNDGGATWTGIEGSGDGALPEVPLLHVLPDPAQDGRLFLASDLGVFVSLDGGASWLRDQNPFANVVTERLELRRDAGVATLFAFTFGRGVWKTDLPGTGTPCAYAVSELAPVPAFGGRRGFQVEAGEGCAWSAISGGASGTIVSPANGTGSRAVEVDVAFNPNLAARPVIVAVQDRVLRVQQAGALGVPRNDSVLQPAVPERLPYVGVLDSRTFTADDSDPEHSCTGQRDFKSAWWRITPTESGLLRLFAQGRRYDVFGNSGVVLAVYRANEEGRPGAELGCGRMPRNTTAWTSVNAEVGVEAGQSYLVRVSATGNAAADGGYTILGLELRPQ